MLNCDVSAGDNVGTLSVPHPDETFAPILPMSFGLYNDVSDGQKFCLSHTHTHERAHAHSKSGQSLFVYKVC